MILSRHPITEQPVIMQTSRPRPKRFKAQRPQTPARIVRARKPRWRPVQLPPRSGA